MADRYHRWYSLPRSHSFADALEQTRQRSALTIRVERCVDILHRAACITANIEMGSSVARIVLATKRYLRQYSRASANKPTASSSETRSITSALSAILL